MEKIFCMFVALLLIVSMAVPAYAVTPALDIPDMPDISDIQIKVNLDDVVYENAVDKWLAEHPFKFDFSKFKLPIFGG